MELPIPQYSRRRILGTWAAAALPMAVLAWIVAPWLAGELDGPTAWPRAILLSLTVGMVWHAQLSAAGTPLRFAPSDIPGFFEPLGWREDEFHPTWTDSIRLDRTAPQGPAWNLLWQWSTPAAKAALERMSGVALFERLA